MGKIKPFRVRAISRQNTNQVACRERRCSEQVLQATTTCGGSKSHVLKRQHVKQQQQQQQGRVNANNPCSQEVHQSVSSCISSFRQSVSRSSACLVVPDRAVVTSSSSSPTSPDCELVQNDQDSSLHSSSASPDRDVLLVSRPASPDRDVLLVSRPAAACFVMTQLADPTTCHTVTLRPQRCTCGEGQRECVHVRFLINRVLNVPSGDDKLLPHHVDKFDELSSSAVHSAANTSVISASCVSIDASERGVCLMCWTKMRPVTAVIDGGDSQVVRCTGVSCTAVVHSSCLSVCVRHHVRPSCVLCGSVWLLAQTSSSSPSSSSSQLLTSQTRRLASSGRTNMSNMSNMRKRQSSGRRVTATVTSPAVVVVVGLTDPVNRWSPVLGRDLARCLCSTDWRTRDNGIARLTEQLETIVKQLRRGGPCEVTCEVSWCCLDVIIVLLADPVHKILVAAIKCLRTVLPWLSCVASAVAESQCGMTAATTTTTTNSHVNREDTRGGGGKLLSVLSLLLDALLQRAADMPRRGGQLCCNTLLQLLHVPELRVAGVLLDRVALPVDCDNWQFCLGRLAALRHVLVTMPRDFCLLSDSRTSSATHDDDDDGGMRVRLARVAEFCCRASKHSHPTVSQLARDVLVQVAVCMWPHDEARAQVTRLMTLMLEPTVATKLRRAVDELTHGDVRQDASTDGAPPRHASHKRKRVRPRDSPQLAVSVRSGDVESVHSTLDKRMLKKRQGHLETPHSGQEAANQLSDGSVQVVQCHSSLEASEEDAELVVFPPVQGEVRLYYTENVNWVRGELLGSGSFSSCYQAWDRSSGRIMAVKTITLHSQQQRTVASVELHLLTSLQHERIVRLLGATRRPGSLRLFIEWQAGGSVAALLTKYGAFGTDVVRRYCRQLIEGLVYLHDHRVVHRDLKGGNLLVDASGQYVKIADLGVSCLLRSDVTLEDELRGEMLGTLAFMAPEVMRGEHYGRASDVWSVGCCVIEMASGKLPWSELHCANFMSLLFKIAASGAPPAVPDDLADDLRSLVIDCHRMEQTRRPLARQLLHHPCLLAMND